MPHAPGMYNLLKGLNLKVLFLNSSALLLMSVIFITDSVLLSTDYFGPPFVGPPPPPRMGHRT